MFRNSFSARSFLAEKPVDRSAPRAHASLIRVLVASNVRLYREALESRLELNDRLIVATVDCGAVLESVAKFEPDLILLDAAEWRGLDVAETLVERRPRLAVVLLGVPETVGRAIAATCPDLSGFVPRDGSMEDVDSLVEKLTRGDVHGPAAVAPAALRNGAASSASGVELTRREGEILELIELGFSNKDIARRLNISVGTAKNHVHNILEKLNVRRRDQAAHAIRALPRLASELERRSWRQKARRP